jgi:hypothetical protein
VTGSVAGSADTRDYFTFNIATGKRLTDLFLFDYTDLDGRG